MDLLLLFGSLVLLMVLGLPISFSMGVSGLFFLLVTGQSEMLVMIPNRMVMALDSYGLMAIPFFYLAGSLMLIGGLTLRLVAFSRAMIGHVTGGLSLVNVIASMIFAGVSGSCVADASAIGSVMIPAMKKDRYPADFAAAVTASAATCGHIIPPSIPFVIFGSMTALDSQWRLRIPRRIRALPLLLMLALLSFFPPRLNCSRAAGVYLSAGATISMPAARAASMPPVRE